MWHESDAAQTTGVPAHAPALQASACVHAYPSSQGVPFAADGSEHAPVCGSQVPTMWHESDAVHTTGVAPTQEPAWQLSVCVQALPSSQGVPFAADGSEHAPVSRSQ